MQFNRSGSSYYLIPDIETDGTGAFVRLKTLNLKGYDSYNLGMLYDMSIDLPQIYAKRDKLVDRVDPPMVTNVNLEMYLSGNYTVTTERLGYDPIVEEVEAKQTDVYFLGNTSMVNTATRAIPVYCRGDQLNINIRSLDPLPAGITGYTWEGHYNNRGINRIV